jgi:hypothetical protein
MRQRTILQLVIVTCLLGLRVASAEEPQRVTWQELLPVKVLEDPFEKLNDEQLQDLSEVARVRMLLAQKKISAQVIDVQAALKTEKSLRKQGVDVDFLLQQRARVRQLRSMQGHAVEKSLAGKRVKIGGYIIPIRAAKTGLTEFLLVSSVDACSHANPPPPNQVVFIQVREAIGKLDRRTPIVVTGRMKTEPITKQLLRGSGPTNVTAAYGMEADSVVVYSASK